MDDLSEASEMNKTGTYLVGIVNQDNVSPLEVIDCFTIEVAEELAVDISQDTNKVVGIWKYVEPDLAELHKLVFRTRVFG